MSRNSVRDNETRADWYYVTGVHRDEFDPTSDGDTGMAALCPACAARLHATTDAADGDLWYASDGDDDVECWEVTHGAGVPAPERW